MFVQRPVNQVVLVDESLEFRCQVHGDPKPTLRWKKDDVDLSRSRWAACVCVYSFSEIPIFVERVNRSYNSDVLEEHRLKRRIQKQNTSQNNVKRCCFSQDSSRSIVHNIVILFCSSNTDWDWSLLNCSSYSKCSVNCNVNIVCRYKYRKRPYLCNSKRFCSLFIQMHNVANMICRFCPHYF